MPNSRQLQSCTCHRKVRSIVDGGLVSYFSDDTKLPHVPGHRGGSFFKARKEKTREALNDTLTLE
jgi:hypothetical protein